ncbi:MAG: hypothetical protein K6E59_04905, partial [Bacilli bacterium]|nr:hypothetical protein [Bacilli bacterium]
MNMRTMRQSFVWALLIPGIILTFIMASTMVFGFLYASTGSSTFQSLLYIVDLALVFIYVTVGIIEVRTLHRLYQEGLYEISRRNLGHLRHGDGTLERYPEENIAELKDLNRALEDVEQKWKYSILYSVEADYSQLGIEWVDESKHLVPAGFLKERLQSLVHVYGVFYVGLLELYYEIGKEKLDEEEKQRLLALADDRFRFVKGRLFAFTEDEKGMLCFLPGLDSIRIVQEKVVSMADDSAISKRGSSGLGLFPLKGALVCYPYSSVSDMLEDLRYAKRQTAPITVFLPDRKKAKSNPLGLAEHSDAKAFFKSVNHALRRLSDESLGKDKTNLQTVYEAVASFLGTDFNELILHDQLNGTYYPYFHDLGDHIEAKVLQPLFDSLDFNDSVYFSCRESCPAAIAREVDLYGVTSGFIFALRNGKDYLGVAYFEKRGGELVVDSYVRDQLVRFGQDLADYFMMAEKETRAKAFQREAEAIMGLSNHMVYRIDENTHQITYFSPNMRSLFHDVAVGEVCHKALYGIDRPCPHCPLLEMAKMKDVRKAKMSGKVREVELETSLTLDAHTARERILLVRPTEGKLSEDPYDRNWLVYSYAALLSQLENAYRIHSRGYLLLLSIDNMTAFLQQWG